MLAITIAVAFLGVGELLIVIWMFLCLRSIDDKLDDIYAMVWGLTEDRGLDDPEDSGDPDGA
jgi:hypothetical protein